MTVPSSERIHASCVAIAGQAVLLSGPSGAGKSDLALRLIDRGATLVSDDYTVVTRDSGRVIANAPSAIRGKIEVRGVGIVALANAEPTEVALMICLDEMPQRHPEPMTRLIAGVAVPAIALDPFQASAPIKVEFALKALRP